VESVLHLTNEVRFGFDLAPIHFLTTQQFGGFIISNTLFNNPDNNQFPSGRKTNTWSWQDNASWSRGNHTLAFGMQEQRVTIFSQNYVNTVANLTIGDDSAPMPSHRLISLAREGYQTAICRRPTPF